LMLFNYRGFCIYEKFEKNRKRTIKRAVLYSISI
jgi:hypothetical protein